MCDGHPRPATAVRRPATARAAPRAGEGRGTHGPQSGEEHGPTCCESQRVVMERLFRGIRCPSDRRTEGETSMSRGSRVLTVMYIAVALWLAYCTVRTWGTVPAWTTLAMAAASLAPVLGVVRETVIADERRAVAVLREREGRRAAWRDAAPRPWHGPRWRRRAASAGGRRARPSTTRSAPAAPPGAPRPDPLRPWGGVDPM